MKAIPFGRYVLLQKLAMGGTAEIFKAKLLGVEGFEKEVVIKRILAPWSANPQFISMLIDEAKILVKLQHEKIVQVYELGRENDLYYISMEYVKGWDLRHIFRHARENSKPFALSECFYVIAEILKGLDYIHKQKDKYGHNLEIVHRDISPQNILISTEGKIKIADFGIAHARSRSYETSTGVIKGKFSYMSPEQARGEKLNLKTDLFATGILLYEMLTLQKLFQGKSDLEVLDQVRNFKLQKSTQNLILSPLLINILHKALHPKTSHRYSSAQEFLKELQDASRFLSEENGETLFLNRLKSLPSPEKENEEFKFNFDTNPESQTQAIVARDWLTDTSFENTRTLENIFKSDTDRNPSLTPVQKIKNKKVNLLITFFVLFLLIFLFFYFYRVQKSHQIPVVLNQNPTKAESTSVESLPQVSPETLPSNPPLPIKPVAEKTTSPNPIQKGSLSVRAIPWGKISVSGIASNMEKPLLRSIPYGTYRISVKYQNDQGEWSTVSQSVKIAKASTMCSASFQKSGKGFISCR